MHGSRSGAKRSFAVTPPPMYAMVSMVLLAGVLPAVGIGVALWFTPDPASSMSQAWPILVIVPAVLAFLFLAMKRRSVELASGVLDVRAALFRERTPVADIDLERARLVDLAERTDLRPMLKTNGMSLPGFHAGRFRLRGKLAKAFCLVTDRRRVLWLPLHDGKQQLLLSVEQPQALLDALRAGH